MTKALELETIRIEKVIVHDLPKHRKTDTDIEPNYSEQESKLSDGLRLFFKDKVVQALSSDKAFKICYDPDNTSPVPTFINDIINASKTSVINYSKSIAKHLFEVQVGNNASGVLVIIYGKISGSNTCVILKLERDQGAQLILDPITKSYDIEEVKDLMLTQKTKIYKVALFITRSDFGAKYDGLVMDYQIDVKAKKEVVTFFIDKFLGCKAYEDPKITTKKFYDYTRSFIYTISDDIEKAKYLQDLNSYVQKNTFTINPKEFADDYLKTEVKNSYKSFLEAKNFSFSESPKNNHFIENKIKKFLVLFENEVSIISNKGSFGDKVKLEKLDNGLTRAVVTSKIKKME